MGRARRNGVFVRMPLPKYSTPGTRPTPALPGFRLISPHPEADLRPSPPEWAVGGGRFWAVTTSSSRMGRWYTVWPLSRMPNQIAVWWGRSQFYPRLNAPRVLSELLAGEVSVYPGPMVRLPSCFLLCTLPLPAAPACPGNQGVLPGSSRVVCLDLIVIPTLKFSQQSWG